MKSMLKAAVFGALIATAGLAPVAYAANIETTQVLVLTPDGEGGFGNQAFGATYGAFANNLAIQGQTFSNQFTFSVGGPFDTSGSVSASYTKVARTNVITKDVHIDSFDVFSSDGTRVIAGFNSNPTTGTAQNDAWYLPEFALLTAGNYYVQVTGSVLGTTGGSYGTTLSLTPAVTAVPEAETYAMLLAGLGLVGFVGRRKAAKKAA